LIRKAKEADHIHYVHLGKLAVVPTVFDFRGIRENSALSEFVARVLQALEF
jgi:hypothetical protein